MVHTAATCNYPGCSLSVIGQSGSGSKGSNGKGGGGRGGMAKHRWLARMASPQAKARVLALLRRNRRVRDAARKDGLVFVGCTTGKVIRHAARAKTCVRLRPTRPPHPPRPQPPYGQACQSRNAGGAGHRKVLAHAMEVDTPQEEVLRTQIKSKRASEVVFPPAGAQTWLWPKELLPT